MGKDHKVVKKVIDNTKKVSNYVVEKTKKAIYTTMYNISYLTKVETFYIIDGKNGNKIDTIDAFFMQDYVYISEKEFEKRKENVLKGNVLMIKETCEMYEITNVCKGQNFTYKIKKGKKEYEVLCKKIEVKRITRIT